MRRMPRESRGVSTELSEGGFYSIGGTILVGLGSMKTGRNAIPAGNSEG